METLQTNTIRARNDSRFQAFEAPCERRGYVSKDAEARRSVETHREGYTETLGAFLSPFEFFRINGLLWCSSLPRGWLLALRGCVDSEALSPCL